MCGGGRGGGPLKRDRVALHLLNQSGAVFTATPTFSQIPPVTPFNPPSLNSTAPHFSQEEPRMGASQVCVRACERVFILQGWRIDGIHKVERTSRTSRAAWQVRLEIFQERQCIHHLYV